MSTQPLTPFNQQQFDQLLAKYCAIFNLPSAEHFSKKQWYQLLTEGCLGWIRSQQSTLAQPSETAPKRHVNYLSLEFLIGRLTANNLLNLGWYELVKQNLAVYQLELSDILEQEDDPALGNGGLGRLAACFLDSMATLGQPATGYGLYYQYGLFKQSFANGEQQESPDSWQAKHYPWATCAFAQTCQVGFAGEVKHIWEDQYQWQPAFNINAYAYDLPIVGYANLRPQTLRLWQADNEQLFDFEQFNEGNFAQAEEQVNLASALTKVLYPNDNHLAGKKLRLMQQYFHCACSVADIVERHLAQGFSIQTLPEKQVIQLNDTHPTLAIVELMRLLLDQHKLDWHKAWQICCQTFAYTNHTLLPEALEQWDQELVASLLPRHFLILEKINQQFQQKVRAVFGENPAIWQKLAIIYDYQIRMANLCVVCCFAVNGVAKLHSELLVSQLFPEYHQLFPNKFCNVTNGITPRRWIRQANPRLARLLDQRIKQDWTKELTAIQQIEQYATEDHFLQAYRQIKQQNKQALAAEIQQSLGLAVNCEAIFDVQIKRFHEYKRQHLNLLNIIAAYLALKDNPNRDYTPRLFIFAGKAAPGYYLAKNIIHAINQVASLINQDPQTRDKLQLAFLADYRVSLAEKIIPAADVSEQISMAGKEASGTGNMKLALNGALTIGTLDGANVEIAERVGEEHIFLFGHTVDSVKTLLAQGYQPQRYYQQNPELKQALDFLQSPLLCGKQLDLFEPLRANLLQQDPFLVLADFASYAEAQQKIGEAYLNPKQWYQSALLNSARLGHFSSDRAIKDYQTRIWQRA